MLEKVNPLSPSHPLSTFLPILSPLLIPEIPPPPWSHDWYELDNCWDSVLRNISKGFTHERKSHEGWKEDWI